MQGGSLMGGVAPSEQQPYNAMGVAVAVEGSMSPTTEKDTPAFEQAVKRNNLELSDRGDEAQAENDDE